MKLICISDVHNKISDVVLPPGDLLIIAGDLTMKGTTKEYIKFNNDLEKIKSLYKYGVMVINGNHDFLGQKDFNFSKLLLTNVNYYLQDSEVTIEGVKFWGSPWQPFFYNWAFNLHRGKAIAEKWTLIPEDTNVLITHGPPKNILDIVEGNWGITEHVGCEDLLHRIMQLSKLKAHIFGHLHLNGGKVIKSNNTIFANASICDESYSPTNSPIVIEI